MRCGLLSTLLALSPLALADVEFISPAAGASIPAGPITVQWQESGTAPLISTLESYTLQLIVGGNVVADAQPLVNIGAAQGTFTAGNEATGTISPTLASSLTNGFYLQMISTAKDGGTVTNYSGRFTITGMTGTTAAEYVKQVTALAGATAGPATVDDVTPDADTPAGGKGKHTTTNVVGAAPAAATPAEDAAEFSIPYNLQTGLARYAPMQPIPPTQITANNPTPLFPTSAFNIAQTKLPPASVLTTYTQAQTFSVQSMQNTIAAAPNPNNDMAKFLARWKD